MLNAVSIAVAASFIAQAPDDLVLCTSSSDCPSGAFCEDGVCVLDAAPPKVEKETKRERKRRLREERREERRERQRKKKRRELLPGECRKHRDCAAEQECFRRRCGPEIPSKGLALTITGGVLSGLGAVFLLSSPLCKLDSEGRTRNEEASCLAGSLGAGGVAVAVGVPLLVIGIVQRTRFKAWVEEHHPQLAVIFRDDEGAAVVGFAF